MNVDSLAIQRQALQALQDQNESDAIPKVAEAARIMQRDSRLWQWLGLLHRAIDQREHAIPAFEAARTYAPQDAQIAHSLARARLEAGITSIDEFECAAQLAPADGDILLGLAAARLAQGQGDAALAGLDTSLSANPFWLAGHRDRIQLAWLLGRIDTAFAAWKKALVAAPKSSDLWLVGIAVMNEARRYQDALSAIARARKSCGDGLMFDASEAVAASELGNVAAADQMFSVIHAPDDPAITLHRLRHALRNGRIDVADALLGVWLGEPGGEAFWPYADIIWRINGDARLGWLHPAEFVRVIDLGYSQGEINQLALCLRGIHVARHPFPDQSVRGGTQTNGALFARIEPEIRLLRTKVVAAVTDYVAALPPRNPAHPLLGQRRDREPRFAGSWSVRLAAAGHHSNHVHPMGWISSAFYVALPASEPNEGAQAGWLSIGEPQAELNLSLPPVQVIKPKTGRLVLFPSTLWHGTRPFALGERLTAAFDVARPLI